MSDGSPHPHPVAGPGPQTAVVTLPGEIDLANGEQVHDALARPLRDGAAVLVADVTRATFFASAGVKELMHAHHQAAAAGAQLRVAASPAVRRILELTGASQLLDIYPTVTAALNSADPAPQIAPG